MCGGGGGGGGEDPVKYQRKEEEKRQQRIAQGKGQLEKMFSGLEGYGYKPVTTSGTREVQATPDMLRDAGYRRKSTRSYDDTYAGENGGGRRQIYGSQWYDPQGNAIDSVPGTMMQRYTDTEQKRVKQGDPIWEQQQKAYMDYAKPQLEQQFGDAQEQLTYALSRQGQTRGSLSGDRRADLSRDYDLRRQEVADKGRGVANQARSDIASQKQSLMQMLTASADPGATATAARSAVSSLQNTPEFSPLGPLFQNATAGLAQGMQGRQNQQLQEQVQGIQYGRDPDRGSGRVIR